MPEAMLAATDARPAARSVRPSDATTARETLRGQCTEMLIPVRNNPKITTGHQVNDQAMAKEASAHAMATRRIDSVSKARARRAPKARPMNIPPTTEASDAAAAAGPNPHLSRSRSAPQKVRENSAPITQTSSNHDHQNARGILPRSTLATISGGSLNASVLRPRQISTAIKARITTYMPARQPSKVAAPMPITNGPRRPAKQASAFASVSAAGPAKPS